MTGIMVRDADGVVLFRGKAQSPKPGTTWVDDPDYEDATRTLDGEEFTVEELAANHNRPGVRTVLWDGSQIVAIPQSDIDQALADEAKRQAQSTFDRPDDDLVIALRALMDVLETDHGINLDRSRVRARFIQLKERA